MNYKEILSEKINNLLSNKWTVPEFEKEYYTYFLEQIPENTLTLQQSTFYGLVQEKLDWTAENPSDQEKKDGWLNHSEYTEWLKENNKHFQENDNLWYENFVRSFKK